MKRPAPRMGTEDDTLLERTGAWIIDTIVVLLILAVIAQSVHGFWPNVQLAFVVSLVYRTALEGASGQTIGKKLLGVVVVLEDGGDCTWSAAVLRNLLRLIDGFPAFYLVGVVAIFASDDGQRIGDKVGNTVVAKVATGPEPEPEPDPEPDPEPVRQPSGLLVDEVRRQGNDTYLVLRNAAEEPIDLSEAKIDDANGNRHPIPGAITIAPATTETFRFGASTEFDPDYGTPLVLFATDGEYEIGWGETPT